MPRFLKKRRSSAFSKEAFRPNNGTWYAETLAALHKNPGCVGFHLCGAYQRNKARRRGLLDEMENPDTEQVNLMQAANQKISHWMDSQFCPPPPMPSHLQTDLK